MPRGPSLAVAKEQLIAKGLAQQDLLASFSQSPGCFQMGVVILQSWEVTQARGTQLDVDSPSPSGVTCSGNLRKM